MAAGQTTKIPDPYQTLRSKILQNDILEFMGGLPPQQRLAFELRFYQGLTFEEMADVAGKAVGTVKANYRQAVLKLREHADRKGWRS